MAATKGNPTRTASLIYQGLRKTRVYFRPPIPNLRAEVRSAIETLGATPKSSGVYLLPFGREEGIMTVLRHAYPQWEYEVIEQRPKRTSTEGRIGWVDKTGTSASGSKGALGSVTVFETYYSFERGREDNWVLTSSLPGWKELRNESEAVLKRQAEVALRAYLKMLGLTFQAEPMSFAGEGNN
jgi:hypothetical protein